MIITHMMQFVDKTKKRILFDTTASEVEEGSLSWLDLDRDAVRDQGFELTEFSFTKKTPQQVAEALASVDGIFVAGGNTFFLLQEMHKSGAIPLIQEKVKEGFLYIGSSAGSVVAGKDIDTAKDADDPALAPDLQSTKGLGLVDLLVLPHWGNEHFQAAWMKTMPAIYAKEDKLLLLRDSQYLRLTNDGYVMEQI